MGTGRQDRFVVITDGRDLMHVNLFWRDRIPRGWKGLGGGRPRRMACDYPVRFGDPARPGVAVRAVRDRARLRDVPRREPPRLRLRDAAGPLLNALAALRGGDPAAAPHGAERIDWYPRKRTCRSRGPTAACRSPTPSRR